MIEIVVLIAAAVVGGLRVLGVKSVLFQAVAHCLVGFLFGFGLPRHAAEDDRRGFLFGVAITLTLIEIFAFIVSKLT